MHLLLIFILHAYQAPLAAGISYLFTKSQHAVAVIMMSLQRNRSDVINHAAVSFCLLRAQ